MRKLLLLFIGISLAIGLYAQAPQGFSYQAVIRNSEGLPLTEQSIGIQVSLQNETGTINYYVETHNPTTTSLGIVNVSVGEGNQVSGSFEAIPWEQGNVFIKVEVDASGGSNFITLGTTKLMAVPFSLFAASGNQGPQGIQGPEGEMGPQGLPGEDGFSAYQIWLSHGNTGNEEDFLVSLIGVQGQTGVGIIQTVNNGNGTYTFHYSDGSSFTTANLTGPQGSQGPAGPSGLNGSNGLSAYEIWLGAGNTGTINDFLNSLIGSDGVGIVSTVNNGNGTYTFNYSNGSFFTTANLTGPQGAQGIAGPQGPQGPQGLAGTGLTNRGNWSSGTTYNPGDYVFSESSDNPSVNSMWIVQVDFSFVSSIIPKNHLTHWVEFQAPQGEQGPPGPLVAGALGQTLRHDGTSWIANSLLYNSGTRIGIGVTPTHTLDVNGQIRIRGGSPGVGKVLTTDATTGVATWQNPPDGSKWTLAGSDIHRLTGNVGIGLDAPSQKLEVLGNIKAHGRFIGGSMEVVQPLPEEEPIFLVKNSAGQVVFAVYESGVRVYVDDTSKSTRGGFAIGGLSDQNKEETGVKYFSLTPDSVRVNINTPASGGKATRGGFAIGGLSDQNKGTATNLMFIAPDSARIYVDNTTKSSRGGFAVGGLSDQNKSTGSFLFITPQNYLIGQEAGSSLTSGLYNSFMGYQAGKNTTVGSSNIFIGLMSGFSNIGGSGNLGSYNFFAGNESGYSNTTGWGNIFQGFKSGYNNTTGTQNVFIGHQSGFSNSSSSFNTFIGYQSGFSNTSGTFNVYIGYQSGYLASSASYNTYLGFQSGYSTTTGGSNVFIGDYSGRTNNIGTGNAFVGQYSGYLNTSGNHNTFLGTNAGYSNTTASFNAFIGYDAGRLNTTGTNNVFLGYQAGRGNTVGGNNLFMGYRSGYVNAGGNFNVFLGYEAGLSNTTNGNNNVFMGYVSGRSNTTGVNNVFIGNESGRTNTTGGNNVFLGNFAGNTNNASNNVFLGNEAGRYNSSGTNNAFMGYFSGRANTTGANNVFIGNESGRSNTTGGSNVFLGNLSGYTNTTGTFNTFIGFEAGYTNNTSYNLFIGYQAGKLTTSGSYNTFMGYQSGLANTTGYENAFIGFQTGLSNTTGFRNVFLGWKAGQSNTTGNYNIFVGREAGMSNTTGTSNVYIGESSGQSNIEGSGNTFIGKSAGGNQTAGGNNVYIGGQAAIYKTSGERNIHIGWHSGAYSQGDDNVLIGYFAGMGSIGSGNVFIGKQAGQNASGWANRLIIETSTNQTTPLIYGEFDNKVLKFSAKVGINTTNTEGFRLHVVDDLVSNDNPAIQGRHNVTPNWGVGVKGLGGYIGVMGVADVSGTGTRFGIYGSASGGTTNWAGYFAGNVYVSGTFSNPSDINLKKNVKQFQGALSKVLQLNAVTYEWKSEEELKGIRKPDEKGEYGAFNFSEGTQLGVIAQEVEAILPELVHTDSDGIKSVDYIKMTPVLIEAIKELKSENDELKARLERLEKLMLDK